MKVKVGVSNRHVHLSEKDLKTLFGEDYKLTILKNLTQPGQYACTETVTIETEKNSIQKVRVLGPVRNYTNTKSVYKLYWFTIRTILYRKYFKIK